eukprot:PITA_04431
MIGNDETYIASIKKELGKSFQMTDLGYVHYYLGIEVTQHPNSIFLSQKKYIGDLLNMFGMIECNPLTTPMEQNLKITSIEGKEFEDATKYRQLVGSLNYLTTTRLDISFIVGILSRFMQKPCEGHWYTAKRVLSYLKGTQDFGISYKTVVGLSMARFSGSLWGFRYTQRVLFEDGKTKKKRQSSIKKESNQTRKSSTRLRLVFFVPLLSIFIKENESRLYLFVSKTATSLSGNSTIRVDTIPGNKMATPLGSD